MRKISRATKPRCNYHRRLRIEALEVRCLLTMLLQGDTRTHHAPSGTDAVITALPTSPYTVSADDFGFTDINDNPPDAFLGVIITTLPTSGSLQLGDVSVMAGQFVSEYDLASANLKFIPTTGDTSTPHPRFTFQVRDDGGTGNGGADLDPLPKSLIFQLTPNVAPAAQNDFYTVQENEVLDQVLIASRVQMVSQPGDPVGGGSTYDFNDSDYVFSASRNYQNGVTISCKKPITENSYQLGPNLVFAAAGGALLTPGTYTDTQDFLSLETDKPAMTITPTVLLSYSRRHLTGQFTVNQVEYDTSGEVLRFDASFEQYASGTAPIIGGSPPPALTGRIQYLIPQPESVSLLQNDADVDGDPLTAVLVAGPQHGTLILQTDGGFRYTPEPGFHGTDTFQYQAYDGIDLGDPTTVTIDVHPLGHAPVGTSGMILVPEGAAYALQAADFGFTDPDDTPADPFSRVKITTLPTAGILTLAGIPVTVGQFVTVTDLDAGNLVLTPATGRPHISLTFQVEDNTDTTFGGANLDPDPKTLTFNAPPIAVDDSYSVNENQILNNLSSSGVSVYVNDRDPDGDPLLSPIITAYPQHGSLTLHNDGGFVYTPDHYFDGIDTFQYQANDGLAYGNPATVTIRVNPISQAPVGTSGSVNMPANDPYALKEEDFGFTDPHDDPPDHFSRVEITTLPASGDLALDGTPVATGQFVTVADLAAGNLVFTPSPFHPHASFTFRVEDSGSLDQGGAILDTNPKTLTFNYIPVVHDDVYEVHENGVLDQSLFITRLSMISEPGDWIGQGKIYDFDQSNGTFSVNASGAGVTNAVTIRCLSFNASSRTLWNLSFSAPNNAELVPGIYPGATRYPFQSADEPGLDVSGDGRGSNTLTGQFTVLQVAHDSWSQFQFDATFEQHSEGAAPALTGRIQYNAASETAISVLENDPDADGDSLEAVLAAPPQHGTLTLNPDGGFVYKPDPGFYGTDSFQYKANDGTTGSNAGTVTIHVNPISHAPSGTSRQMTIPPAAPYAFKVDDFGFSDPDNSPSDHFTRVKITTLPTSGGLVLSGTPVEVGQFVTSADLEAGNLVFTPSAETIGNELGSFTFQVEDSGNTDNGGEILDPTPKTLTLNILTVDVFQAAGQADPTNASPIHFTVIFSEEVTDFDANDVTLSGMAGAATVTVTGSGTTYDVAVGGMTGGGIVVLSIAEGVASDAEGNPNAASINNDNSVYFIDVNQPPVFTLTGPASGEYAPGQPVTVTWTAGNVPGGCKISLCLDEDTQWMNGNEHWLEIDQVDAANGNGEYVFDPTVVVPGAYYVGGYLYNFATYRAAISPFGAPITLPAPTFTLTGPASGAYAPGQPVTISWQAGNIPVGGAISLCLDQDTITMNGNERWIEIDQVAAANGSFSYAFDSAAFAPGRYYVGGYLYNFATHTAVFSCLEQPITITTTYYDAILGILNDGSLTKKEKMLKALDMLMEHKDTWLEGIKLGDLL
ncbi:MAG: tandem-95 repeat protein [Pirellulales bacterium]|nr:tandem-95 repeat protein [Pirellulales bacterium]